MNHNITRKPKEGGQSMVELALTITLLMVLLSGTIDLGRAFFTWLTMRDAAQEGASYGSIAPPSASFTCNPAASPLPQICARVWDGVRDVVRNPETSIMVIVTVDHACLGGTIKVDLIYPGFTLAMPFLGTVIGSQTIPIHATIDDTVLKPACP
jgi:hypothetical protein